MNTTTHTPSQSNTASNSAQGESVLVVEDEPRLARLVSEYLRAAGYSPRVLDNGLAVVPSVRAEPPALIVLDLMLPGRDGLSICQELRQFSQVPIIMLTARIEEIDRLLGLEAGADDYICKPFSPREVVARVKAVLRRAQPVSASGSASGAAGDAGPAGAEANPAMPALASVPGMLIDSERFTVAIDGQVLDLTPVEFRLLKTLAAAPGRVFARDQLLDRLHDDQRALNDRTVDSHVKNLRRKLQQACPEQEPIRSIYGVGYKFEWDAPLSVHP